MIYLDNAATTYPKPNSVYEALDKANRNAFNSGRGSYKVARDATQIIDRVRNKILSLNKITNAKTIFTSSATSALNNILFGIEYEQGDNVYVSPFEHNSVIRPLEELKKIYGINIIVLPFNKNTWSIDSDKLKNQFAINKPKCIILSHISNATGYILPYENIFNEGKKYNSINILDSAQGYGIVPINGLDDISYIIFAGHKSLYSCFGIAGYIKLKNDRLKQVIFGGTGSDTMNPNMPNVYPDGYEAGSINIVGISGLDASIDWLSSTDIYNHEKQLTHYLISELKKIDKCQLYLPDKYDNIFGIVAFNIDGYKSDEVGNILNDEFDISVRTGYHCAPLIHDFLSSLVYNGSIRVSLNYFNTESDIEALINALKSL